MVVSVIHRKMLFSIIPVFLNIFNLRVDVKRTYKSLSLLFPFYLHQK